MCACTRRRLADATRRLRKCLVLARTGSLPGAVAGTARTAPQAQSSAQHTEGIAELGHQSREDSLKSLGGLSGRLWRNVVVKVGGDLHGSMSKDLGHEL